MPYKLYVNQDDTLYNKIAISLSACDRTRNINNRNDNNNITKCLFSKQMFWLIVIYNIVCGSAFIIAARDWNLEFISISQFADSIVYFATNINHNCNIAIKL